MQLPVAALPDAGRDYDVVGIGLNAADTVVVVPAFPAFADKVEIASHTLMFGGQVATAMVGMQRLGYRSRYIGRVGSDHVGPLQIASIEAEGVDCSELRVVEGAESQIAVILVEVHHQPHAASLNMRDNPSVVAPIRNLAGD